MAQHSDSIFRKPQGTDVLRVYPNANVEFYTIGSSGPPVASVTADANGIFTVADLPMGTYEVRVDGEVRQTIQFVPADHVHTPDRDLIFGIAGTISSDIEETSSSRLHVIKNAGSLLSVELVFEHVDASANCVVHLLSGTTDGATAMTLSSTIYSQTLTPPGVERYRKVIVDEDPGVDIAANSVLAIGVDYIAGTIEGLTVTAAYRQD